MQTLLLTARLQIALVIHVDIVAIKEAFSLPVADCFHQLQPRLQRLRMLFIRLAFRRARAGLEV